MKLLSIGLLFFSRYFFLKQELHHVSENRIDSNAINAIRINQVSAHAENRRNEFGYKTGWIELVNISDKPVYLPADRWSVSNDELNPALYTIRKNLVIAPHENFLIWCDKLSVIQKDLHSNFKLGKKGNIGLYYLSSTNNVQCIDKSSYYFSERERTESNFTSL